MITDPPVSVTLTYELVYGLEHSLRVYASRRGIDGAATCQALLAELLDAAYQQGHAEISIEFADHIASVIRETAFALMPSDPDTAAGLGTRLTHLHQVRASVDQSLRTREP